MGTLWIGLGVLIALFITVTLYACLVAGSRADDQMEQWIAQREAELAKEK